VGVPWIKVEQTIFRKVQVGEIARLCGMSTFEVVGRLINLWIWFDENTLDGEVAGMSLEALATVTHERYESNADVTLASGESLNKRGSSAYLTEASAYKRSPTFLEALIRVGWLEVDEDRIAVPRFSEKMGQSAKARALTAARVARSRRRESASDNARNGQGVTKSKSKSKSSSSSPNVEEEGERTAGDTANKGRGRAYWAEQMERWNRLAERYPVGKALRLSESRKKHIQARHLEYGGDFWPVVEKLLDDRVVHPDVVASHWFTIEWLIKSPDNFLKAVEGRYRESRRDSSNDPLATRRKLRRDNKGGYGR